MWRQLGNIRRGLCQIFARKHVECNTAYDDENECGQSTVSRQKCCVHRSHQDGGDREEKSRHCQWNSWANAPQHSFLEALGWGTVLVLGCQLTQPLCRRDRKECDSHQYGLPSWETWNLIPSGLTLVACAQPQLSRQIVSPGKKGQLRRRSRSVTGGWQLGAQSGHGGGIHAEPDTDNSREVAGTGHFFGPITVDQACDEALLDLKKAEDAVVGAAQNWAGVQLLQQSSESCGFRCLQTASELGSAAACFNLGLCYERGLGTQPDVTQAAQYYQRAAAAGHTAAMYNLAVFYMEGRGGLPVDSQAGIALLRQAAENGLREAHMALGVCRSSPVADHDSTTVETSCSQNQYYADVLKEEKCGFRQTVSFPVLSDQEKLVVSPVSQSLADLNVNFSLRDSSPSDEGISSDALSLSDDKTAHPATFYVGDGCCC